MNVNAPPRRPPPPRQAEREGGGWWVWLLALLAILLLGAIGFLGAQILGGLAPGASPSPSAEQVEVPDWVGDPIAAVRSEAEELGISISVAPEREPSDEFREGSVISTDPAAGELVSEGDTVTVVVSSGPDEVAVPRLRGQTESQATQTLLAEGLDLGTVTQEPSADVAEGRVIRSDPAEGVSVERGDQVDIVLSTGPTPSPTPSPEPTPTPTPIPTPTPTPTPTESDDA